MDTEKIIETITNIFAGADERNWDKVKNSFADKVLLDYSSMNGSPAVVLSSADIIAAWKCFLPGFDLTHHQVSQFRVDEMEGVTKSHFFGKADHFINNDSWTVEGTYDVELITSADGLKVNKFRFNLQKQSGDTGLPQRAVEICKPEQ
ncbi:MAG TPA: nuclear transport factor 2 family protein [Mucilaginibacter sp.]|jgi:hypothetical protein|nr:nuclear transport factor 2 family protein [Mucilaginibacter sp.]